MAYVQAIEPHPELTRISRDEARTRATVKLHVTSSVNEAPGDAAPAAVPQVVVLPPLTTVASQVHESLGTPELTDADQRSAMRTEMVDWASMAVNGIDVELIALSATGAQIRSPFSLTPGSPVQLMLKSGADRVQCRGKVVWGVPETTVNGGYRAALMFAVEDRKSVEWLWNMSVRRSR